jgi:ribosome-binding ATPase YchF (GTP1/OBG family)
MLSDLESLEKRVPAAQKKATQGDKENKLLASVLAQALELLREGKPARLTCPGTDEEERKVFASGSAAHRQAGALCLQCRRGSGGQWQRLLRARVRKGQGRRRQRRDRLRRDRSELIGMDDEERMVFLEEMGLHETGLARVIRAGYDCST